MIFTDIFIKRPVFATSISLMILLVGLISLTKLDVRLFPKIVAAVVNVTVTYPGANEEIMEGFVSTPLENSIAGVEGIDYITSQSSQNTSSINVYMKIGYDPDIALINVSNEVAAVRWKLPDDIQDPVVSKQDPNSQPTLYYAFTSDSMSQEAVTDYLLRVVQPQLQMQTGVDEAQILGSREYAMRIWLDPHQMAARNVTATDIKTAIYNNNVLAAAGKLKGTIQEYNIHSNTDFTTAAQFNKMLVRNDKGHVVHLGDIGYTKLGSTNTDVSINYNDGKATFLAIIPTANANPLNVAKAIKKVMPGIEERFPDGLNVSLMWDSSKFISASLDDVGRTIIEAGIFVFLVIFLMLGSLRAVLVPLVTIPLSLIGVCSFMLICNYTINTLTLLAFVLAIGLVVDDAIVVLENVHRHLEEGLSPFKSAIIGAREIAFAVIAMTLTLAAVYAPIGFMTGLTGTLFAEFAFTLAASVVFSGFIALTLSPMMCSKIYTENENLSAGFPGMVNKIFDVIVSWYKKLLHVLIHYRIFVIIFTLIVYAACYFLYANTQNELAPYEDQGGLTVITKGPAYANIHYMEKNSKTLANIYKKIPEVTSYGIVNGYPIGINSSISILVFTPWDKRKRTAMDIQNELYPKLWAVPAVLAYPSNFPPLPGASGYTPVEYALKTTGDYASLRDYTVKFMDAINEWGGLINVDTDLKIDRPQTEVNVLRDEAIDLNIPMSEIADSLSVFLGKPITTWFNMTGRSYEVLPQLFDQYKTIPDKLKNLNVRSLNNKLFPLSNVVKVQEDVVPRTLNHFQELRSATITANLAQGVTQGDAYTYLNNLVKKTLPKNITSDTSGQLRQYVTDSGAMGQTFLFAILFIYLILAAQFESFRDPFIVMLCVPLSIAGALSLLLYCGGTMNIYTEIGLVTLIGLITKNGILIVEFANQQQEKGKDLLEAIVEGAAQRLRPILMTTFAMILGALPLVLASGAGAVSRRQIGLIIVGGMSFGTTLTLFVVPVPIIYLPQRKPMIKI